MPKDMGKPAGMMMVPQENLQTGGGTQTSGQVVAGGIVTRMAPTEALQVSGGPAGAQEERVPAEKMGEARMVPQEFLAAPIVGNPTSGCRCK